MCTAPGSAIDRECCSNGSRAVRLQQWHHGDHRSFVYVEKQRRNAVFSHMARLHVETPAHQALRSHVNLTLGQRQASSREWKCHPSRPRGGLIGQIRKHNNTPPADPRKNAIGRDTLGTTLRPSLSTLWADHYEWSPYRTPLLHWQDRNDLDYCVCYCDLYSAPKSLKESSFLVHDEHCSLQ